MNTGRCFCGEVTFSFDGPINWCGHCHCDSCRRTTSSPMTTFFAVPRTAYTFTGRTPRAFASSEGVRRLFCGACGSPIAYEADKFAHEIHFYLATLEEPGEMLPQFHVFCEEQLPWLQIDDELPRHARSTTG